MNKEGRDKEGERMRRVFILYKNGEKERGKGRENEAKRKRERDKEGEKTRERQEIHVSDPVNSTFLLPSQPLL